MKVIYFCLSIFLSLTTLSQAQKNILLKSPKYANDIYFVPIVKATQESLKGYGVIVEKSDFDSFQVPIVTWPAPGWRAVQNGTGNQAGTVEGDFDMLWKDNKIYAKNHAVKAEYLTGWAVHPEVLDHYPVMSKDQRFYVLTHEINYHPDGGQLFMPKENQPFVALLGLPGDDICPEHFQAFYFDGSFGFCIYPGVWHQPLFPIEDKMTFKDKQGKVHACIYADFLKEFGYYLAVPLFDPEKVTSN